MSCQIEMMNTLDNTQNTEKKASDLVEQSYGSDLSNKGTVLGRPDDETIYRATQIFSALADSTRFKILTSLANQELCVFDLQELCGVSQSAVSHQLRLLRDIDLVRVHRVGQRAYYRLSDDHVIDIIKMGVEHVLE